MPDLQKSLFFVLLCTIRLPIYLFSPLPIPLDATYCPMLGSLMFLPPQGAFMAGTELIKPRADQP